MPEATDEANLKQKRASGKSRGGARKRAANGKRSSSTAGTMQTDLPTPEEILADYRIARRSREASLLGRKEVLTGKAKFGIFGDGKEVAQLAMARAFERGDFRSGYYRDQTFALALGMTTVRAFFAQLYADTHPGNDPASSGRQMNAHFATRLVDTDGEWLDHTALYNSSADVSPTASQMPRLVGLSYASRLYRELEELAALPSSAKFSKGGNEVAFGTIGNASAAEGMFFESVNAIGVNRSPAVISVWDDGYGISVPNSYQMTKGSVSAMLAGLQRNKGETSTGYEVRSVPGWDYAALISVYREAAATARSEHVPSLIHVTEMTQPQGHSTSGSHERYKSAERLAFEKDFDPIVKMRAWMIERGIATAEILDVVDAEEKQFVREEQRAAWGDYLGPIRTEMEQAVSAIETAGNASGVDLRRIAGDLTKTQGAIYRRDIHLALSVALRSLRNEELAVRQPLISIKSAIERENRVRFGDQLTSETSSAAQSVPAVAPFYPETPERLKGFEILNRCFDAALARDPRIVAFGEDVGQLGDVDQGFAGLQTKHGPLRVSDTGIREATILGQAIGMSMRGIRPIAEIQYLDYLLYALQLMSDDLATVRYRTRGGQVAPVIVRTRGHRLEGIWHSGSPMAGILNLVRGMHVLVPRDMTRAAGFYNTMLQSDDPALIVEVLSGYRTREPLPENIDSFTIRPGITETLRFGGDVTIVTYGACCRFAMEAADVLAEIGIEVEIIDVQSLLPFDTEASIASSIAKTNRVIFLDEDVPGGATAFMMQRVIEEQDAWNQLDAPPRTITATEHRPAYGTDGGYFSKPTTENIVEAVSRLMNEADPVRFPLYFEH